MLQSVSLVAALAFLPSSRWTTQKARSRSRAARAPKCPTEQTHSCFAISEPGRRSRISNLPKQRTPGGKHRPAFLESASPTEIQRPPRPSSERLAVLPHPDRIFFFREVPCGKPKDGLCCFLLRRVELETIQFKEQHADYEPRSLISIRKRMVADDGDGI